MAYLATWLHGQCWYYWWTIASWCSLNSVARHRRSTNHGMKCYRVQSTGGLCSVLASRSERFWLLQVSQINMLPSLSSCHPHFFRAWLIPSLVCSLRRRWRGLMVGLRREGLGASFRQSHRLSECLNQNLACYDVKSHQRDYPVGSYFHLRAQWFKFVDYRS